MAESDVVLAALAALERRYNGPIPEPIKQIAVHGSAGRWLWIEAAGQAGLFAALIRGQVEAIRRSRRNGGQVAARLFDDLALYRRRRLWWRREANQLRRELCCDGAVKPSAGDAP